MTEWLVARTFMYHLLGRAVSFPITAETVQDLAALEVGADAPPQLRKAVTGLKTRLGEKPYLLVDEVIQEQSRLIYGPGLPPAVPFASYYLDQSHTLFGPETQAVAKFYRESGYAPVQPGTPADHLALELEFMAAMAGVTAEASDRQDEAGVEAAMRTQVEFLNQHLGPFLSRFCRDLRSAASEPFFEHLADLLEQYSALDAALLEEL